MAAQLGMETPEQTCFKLFAKHDLVRYLSAFGWYFPVRLLVSLRTETVHGPGQANTSNDRRRQSSQVLSQRASRRVKFLREI